MQGNFPDLTEFQQRDLEGNPIFNSNGLPKLKPLPPEQKSSLHDISYMSSFEGMKKAYEYYVDRAPLAWAHKCVEIATYNAENNTYIDLPQKPGGFPPFEDWRAETVSYRLDRRRHYISELSEEGDFENTVGNVLDALISAVLLNDSEDLQNLYAKIELIKNKFPKQ